MNVAAAPRGVNGAASLPRVRFPDAMRRAALRPGNGGQLTDRAGDRLLRLVLDAAQVVLADKTLGVDLIDILGARRPRGEPAVGGGDLDAAERLVVAGRRG